MTQAHKGEVICVQPGLWELGFKTKPSGGPQILSPFHWAIPTSFSSSLNYFCLFVSPNVVSLAEHRGRTACCPFMTLVELALGSTNKGTPHSCGAAAGMAGSTSDCPGLWCHLRIGLLLLPMSREPSFLINGVAGIGKLMPNLWQRDTGSLSQTDCLQVHRHNWMWVLGSQPSLRMQ